MKTKTTYICETCGAEYKHKSVAVYCENSPELPLCPVSIGQSVHVYERYDEPQPDEVVEIIIGEPWVVGAANGWDDPQKFLERANELMCHHYLIRIKNYHQMSKDYDSSTTIVGITNIMVDGKFLEEEPL